MLPRWPQRSRPRFTADVRSVPISSVRIRRAIERYTAQPLRSEPRRRERWRSATAFQGDAIDGDWWDLFQSDALDALVETRAGR